MREILKNYFEQSEIAYDKNIIEKFIKYKEMLVEWNSKFNLTAITDDKGIAVKHFIDSLTIRDYVMGRTSLADVGTGAGFPGIPLKLSGFEGKIVLMDSLKKRAGFLQAVIEELALDNCSAVHMRAEDAGRGEYRETFEVVTARAVANLPVLCEYCLPLVKKKGIFIAMKGPEADTELKASKSAISKLGGKIKTSKKIQLADFERKIIIIDKTSDTPSIYPRKAGTPKRKPL